MTKKLNLNRIKPNERLESLCELCELTHLERRLSDQPGVSLTTLITGSREFVIDSVEACFPALAQSSSPNGPKIVEIIGWNRADSGIYERK